MTFAPKMFLVQLLRKPKILDFFPKNQIGGTGRTSARVSMKRKKEVKLTTPDLVILALLSERPMHGYEINQQLGYRNASDWVEISKPQIYYSLEKLVNGNVIAPASDPDSTQGPDRQKFKVTRIGREKLVEALKDSKWSQQRPPTPFQTWMALSPNLNRANRRKMIDLRIAYVSVQITEERETLKTILSDSGPMVKVASQMVDLCIRQYEVELAWLAEIKSQN